MIDAADLCELLSARGYTFYTGVPCSTFKHVINHVLSAPALQFVMAANEGAALGIAAGAWLGGRKPVVVLQNSGVGNLVNPLTSLSAPYRIPSLLLISARAYPEGTGDEPQHRLIGASVRGLLAGFGVHRIDLPQDPAGIAEAIAEADERVSAREECVAIMVRDKTIGGGAKAPGWARAFSLTRDDALRIVAARLRSDDAVVSTTGKISRALFAAHDRAGSFYMQGSMGHARAIALGIALAQPRRRVVTVDGDGATLMHMGSLSTVGFYAPANLVEVVIDNEAHGSTGNQHTTSSSTDLAAVARACNYARSWFCVNDAELQEALDAALASAGPHLILVKTNRDEAGELPRITSRYEPDAIARSMRAFLTN